VPIFDFRCQQCDAIFEAVIIRTDEAVKCQCGSAEVEKLLSAPGGFKFKGAGFYRTDYKQADMDRQLYKDLRGEK
jgi:putative FmdB family regulatory protein